MFVIIVARWRWGNSNPIFDDNSRTILLEKGVSTIDQMGHACSYWLGRGTEQEEVHVM